MPTRRRIVQLLAAAPFAALAAQDGGEKPAGPPSWPTTQKLVQTNQDLLTLIGNVHLANADAPDVLPRPPIRRPATGSRR